MVVSLLFGDLRKMDDKHCSKLRSNVARTSFERRSNVARNHKLSCLAEKPCLSKKIRVSNCFLKFQAGFYADLPKSCELCNEKPTDVAPRRLASTLVRHHSSTSSEYLSQKTVASTPATKYGGSSSSKAEVLQKDLELLRAYLL